MSDLLARLARSRTRDVAFALEDGDELTFAEWDDASRRHAAVLAARGFGQDARMGLSFDNASYLDFAVAYMAVLRAGATAVPLSKGLPAGQLDRVIDVCGLAALIHPASTAAPFVNCRCVALDRSAPAGSRQSPRSHTPRPDDLAELVLTSGSTAAPKIVAVPHANLKGELALSRSARQRAGKHLHAIPVGTNWGQFVLRSTLTAAMTGVVMGRFEPSRMLRLVEVHRPSELLLTPPMAHMLLAIAADGRHDLSSIATVRLSGAPAAPAILDRLLVLFAGATVSIGYSSTEAAPACTLMEYPPDPPDSVGRPPDGHHVDVIDERGNSVASGVAGEVRLRVDGIPPRSYLRHQELEPCASTDGWVRTGDFGRLDEDGYLRLAGRRSETVNVGGRMVFTPEVEAALLQHPSVADVAVVGLAADVLGEQLGAAVVVQGSLTPADLRRFARPRLADYQVPSVMLTVDEIPTTAAGKADSLAVQRMLHDRAARGRRGEADHAPLESQLVELWQEILEQSEIDPSDDLAERGASSLDAFAVLARLEQEHGIRVPPSRFLVQPTIRDQVRAIRM